MEVTLKTVFIRERKKMEPCFRIKLKPASTPELLEEIKKKIH